jgi:hypothetical protein
VEVVADVLVDEAGGFEVVDEESPGSTEVVPRGREVVDPASSAFPEHAVTSPTIQHARRSRLTLHVTTRHA